MNTRDMARNYLEDAGVYLSQAREGFEGKNYHICIRRCQECVELSLKALLRLFSIEYPKEHDVSDVFIKERHIFPDEIDIDSLARISKDLARKRGPAIYGYERELKPPSLIFSKGDAKKALDDAEYTLKSCERILRKFNYMKTK